MLTKKFIRTAVTLTVIFLCGPAQANEGQKLTGAWKLKRWVLEDVETKAQKPSAFGERPSGVVIFTPSNRLVALITAENRTVADSVDASSANFKTMYAYSGIFRIDGPNFVTQVDMAGEPKWIGSEQKRGYRFENETLIIESPPATQDGRSWRGILEWERQP